MLTDDFVVYLAFQLIIFGINIIGFRRFPFLCFVALIGSFLIAYQTIVAFDSYYIMGIILVIMNTTVPVIGLSRATKGE